MGLGIDPNAPPADPGDKNPPTATIASHPKKKTKSRKASFELTADEDATFECALDKADFGACDNALTLKKLRRSRHTFRVRAIDKAGTVGPEVSFRWRVKKT
jgi:hypothetical protein